MNIKYIIRQLIKMAVQSVVLPVVYNVSKKKNIDERLVICADAHHTETPYSMVCVRKALEDSDYKVVEIYNNYQTESYISVVKSFMKFMRLYANAKYVFICDNFLPVSSCNKRKETTVVQLWHAGGLLKKYAYDTLDDIPKFYKGNVFKNYSLTVCSAPICIPVYERAMKQEPGTVKATGLSRSDLYFDEEYIKSCKDEFYSMYPEAEGKKLVLWAPTFRGKALEPYVPGVEDIEKLQEQLGEDWMIITKMHPHVDDKKKMSTCDIPTERLLPVVDMLIADYSSVIFDFTLFKKPIVLFVPDYEEFILTRGLYIDLKDIPGAFVIKSEELLEAVKEQMTNFDMEAATQFYDTYMGACDGHATERIFEEIGLKL